MLLILMLLLLIVNVVVVALLITLVTLYLVLLNKCLYEVWGLHSHFSVQPNYSVAVVLCCVVGGVVTTCPHFPQLSSGSWRSYDQKFQLSLHIAGRKK